MYKWTECRNVEIDFFVKKISTLHYNTKPYVSVLYCYNVYAFDNTKYWNLVFLTNSCLVSVFSAVRFCPHDVIMYGAHTGAQRQTAPPPDSTFAIQTYGCFSIIEYVPWQKCLIFNEFANKIPDNFTWNCKGPSVKWKMIMVPKKTLILSIEDRISAMEHIQ